MRRRGRWWVAFGVCVAAVFLALAWITVAALDVERAEYATRAEAEREESIRLALWRMDSLLSPMIAYEAARPHFEYAPYYTPGREWASTPSPDPTAEVVVLSPLARHESEYFDLHFQIEPDGRFTSPQVPDGRVRGLFPADALPDETEVGGHRQRLRDLASGIGPSDLRVRLSAAADALAYLEDPSAPLVTSGLRGRGGKVSRKLSDEAMQRAQANVATQSMVQQLRVPDRPPTGEMNPVVSGPFVPLWVSESDATLVFVRSVRVGDRETIQGFLVNWSSVRDLLLDQIADLFESPDLRPASPEPGTPGTDADMLATVPAVLDVAGPSSPAVPSWTPLRTSLALTWLAAVAAMGAVGFMLRATIAYGDRRSRFASAVTHELRTPLTTFRMYSQMLADGTITDPDRRQKYLDTLERESGRLAHLVENVLSYARLEDGRSRPRRERTTVDDVVTRVEDALARRAADGGMALRVETGNAGDHFLETDVDVVGQVLLNLVDNACKYAASSDDLTVDVTFAARDGVLEARVRDHGPGVPRAHRVSVFSPFHRGALAAGDKTPGIGLGLALARGLARDLGGDLHLDAGAASGACFVLTLPLDRPVASGGGSR